MKNGLELIAIAHRAGQIADALFIEALGRKDITTRQGQLLAAIAETDGTNQTDLVSATDIDRSTLSEMCRRLASKGLVARRRSKRDGRAWVLRLTPEGVALLKQIKIAAGQAAREAQRQIKGIEHLSIVGLPERRRRNRSRQSKNGPAALNRLT